MKNLIDGADLRRMIINAAACVEKNQVALNELNVFPVPDGDTGTNMTMTITAAARDVAQKKDERIDKVAENCASMLLRSARGNSGVILSLLFRGFSKGLKDHTSVTSVPFALALSDGVSAAYSAVMRPAEGTILSVSRSAAEAAVRASANTDDLEELLTVALDAAKEALAKTMDRNPVLARAGVVDAGGQGWVFVLEGFLSAIRGEVIAMDQHTETASSNVFENFDTESIRFAYCTEFIVLRKTGSSDPARLRAFLESIGDCVVVVDDEEIIKVHVHTNHPGKALEEGLKFGSLTSMKVENMKEQHTEKLDLSNGLEPLEKKPAAPDKKYGFAVVAAGEGVSSLFRDLGADQIIVGGQTMNPSTEDIAAAINATPAEIVYVLPNNKNIILAAQTAAPLCDKQVIVLETRTIPQGVSAMLAFDCEADESDNTTAMTDAFSKVRTAQITFAARDSDFDGMTIKKGDYLAISDGKMCYTGPNLAQAIKESCSVLLEKGAEFLTVYRGADATEEQNALVDETIAGAAPDCEVNVIEGGQPIYYYMISAE